MSEANWLAKGIREIKKELKKWPKWKRTTKAALDGGKGVQGGTI